MKVQIPAFAEGQYLNQITSLYSLRKFIKDLSGDKKKQFESFCKSLRETSPLSPEKSEDQVVDYLKSIMKAAGWEASDRRSTPLPNTDLKPDLWLDDKYAFVEALKLKRSDNSSSWSSHCKRCVVYARQSEYQISICSDGRRWFIVSTEDGEAKTAYIDLKRYDLESDEVRAFCIMLWRNGPLYQAEAKRELKRVTELSKNLFKKHILKSVAKLDDSYREYFGLIAATAYAHYNGTKVFETELLLQAIQALAQEHEKICIGLVSDFVKQLADAEIPGISVIARRVGKIVGKCPEKDLMLFKRILVDKADHPISWETFDSDDLSEVYEAILKPNRKRHGIYTTPRDLCYDLVKTQLNKTFENFKGNVLSLVDPCCGSGSFLDQAIRAIGKEVFPAERRNKIGKLKSIHCVDSGIPSLIAPRNTTPHFQFARFWHF